MLGLHFSVGKERLQGCFGAYEYKEGIVLRQKMKAKKVTEGDANSIYFHSSLCYQKSKNAVRKLELDNECVVS